MYADDIVLLSESPEQLQRMLNAVSAFAVKWQFKFNISKSAVSVAGSKQSAKKQRAQSMQWTLSGEPLPVVEYYTYLGLEFGLLGLGRWTPAIRRLLGAARNRTRQLLWANGNARGLDPALQVRLWNTFCRPLLEYGCVLWGANLPVYLSDELERVQMQYAKNVLGMRSAPGITRLFIRGELGLRTLLSRRH